MVARRGGARQYSLNLAERVTLVFKRKPRITDDMYGRLMTSFGRVVDGDPLVSGPARALAERVVTEFPDEAAGVDAKLYNHAAEHHLRLLAGAWIMAREVSVPTE